MRNSKVAGLAGSWMGPAFDQAPEAHVGFAIAGDIDRFLLLLADRNLDPVAVLVEAHREGCLNRVCADPEGIGTGYRDIHLVEHGGRVFALEARDPSATGEFFFSDRLLPAVVGSDAGFPLHPQVGSGECGVEKTMARRVARRGIMKKGPRLSVFTEAGKNPLRETIPGGVKFARRSSLRRSHLVRVEVLAEEEGELVEHGGEEVDGLEGAPVVG